MAAVSPVLVGRDAEIAVLGESWTRVRDGSPATVLIGGEAGIGKTRLVRHFTAGAEAEVLYGGCVDLSGGELPFAPFTAALRRHPDTLAALLPEDVQADTDTARARLFEEVLTQFAGLCILDVPAGPQRELTVPVTFSNDVIMAYVDAEGFGSHHCAFLTSEAEFDSAFARLRCAGITYYAGPHHERPGEINHLRGGRGVYFDDPDGHTIEIITQPYGHPLA